MSTSADDAQALERALRRINEARAAPAGDAATLERELIERFRCEERLAVYGSLAPGEANHHVVSPLGGRWSSGWVEGELYDRGWGAAHGFPGFLWRPGGARVAVRLLASERLRAAWARLDEFEGADYRRSLVPVYADDAPEERRLVTVANIYECVPGGARR